MIPPPPPNEPTNVPPPSGSTVPLPPSSSMIASCINRKNVPPPPPPSSVSVPPPPPGGNHIIQQPPASGRVKKKWTVETEEKIDMANAKAWPLDEKIDWNSVRNIGISENTSSGVFFVETQESGKVIVVKATSSIAAEIFGSRIAQLLELKAPATRLVEYCPKRDKSKLFSYSDREWWAMKDNMVRIAKEKNHQIIEMKVNKQLDRAFFLIMEFVEGAITLEDLMGQPELSRELLTSETVLKELGRMLVLDLLCNNCDRIPLKDVWEHTGNAGNVLFSKTHKSLVCIDQTLFPVISGQEYRDNYLERVGIFKKAISAGEYTHIDSLAKYLESITGIVLDQNHKNLIYDGVVRSFDILGSESFSFDSLFNLKIEISDMLTGEDWADVWKTSINSLDLEWFHENVKRLRN